MPSAEAIKNKTIFEDRDDFRQFRHFLEMRKAVLRKALGLSRHGLIKKMNRDSIPLGPMA